ncbi:MAG: aminotransferase class V-fold PLP-dependent enzyme [Acidimicrobiia bacterium]|nr:aminotransferase class V-fold PLP-dependent enzyme [Acidimicrobiia bacterium]
MTPPLPRTDFPVTERWTYLNHAGVAPLPRPAVEAMAGYAGRVAAGGSLTVEGHGARAEEVRATAAGLMGVARTDVAFVKNTTEGLGFVANGLTWRPGDRVVVPDFEFPSTLYPWLALRELGVVVDLVAPRGRGGCLPVEAFAEVMAAGPPPKVVATSWVQFGRGWRTDLAGLATVCHDAGALLCADVIQGLGVVPADLAAWGVDFAMADAHKWLLGPEGIGVLYVAADRLDLLRPLEAGWASVAHREQWDNRELIYHDDARRLEGGSHNAAGIHAMGASLDLLTGAGMEAVWGHVERLCDRACTGLAEEAGATVLSDRSPGGRSGIVTFRLDGLDAATMHRELGDQGIVCSPRGGGIRIAPHGYNTTEEIDHLVAAVGQLAGGTGGSAAGTAR